MPRNLRFAAIAFAALAAGCTTTMGDRAGPVDVTRYHLGAPIAVGTVSIEPLSSTETVSPEYRTYADAVGAELTRLGYRPAPASGVSEYIAGVAFLRSTAGTVRERPPFTIGFGGGTGGRGGGVGAGVGVGIGGKTRQVIVSELWVQLRRRDDNTVVWEGRAQAESLSGTETAQPIVGANRLARALFKGFPGESGITISVK